MNWYSIFYALTVSDGVKSFFDVASNIFTWMTVILFLAMIILTIAKSISITDEKLKSDEEEKLNPTIRGIEKARLYSRNFFYPMLALSLLTWLGWVMTPTKKDCVMIIAGGTIGNFLQSDTNARKIPGELMELGTVAIQSWQEQIKNMSPEDKKAIGILTPQEKRNDDILNKMEKMTKDELIEFYKSEFLKSDSTISK